MFFRMLAYRRDVRSNQPARKVRQTQFDGFRTQKREILRPRWISTQRGCSSLKRSSLSVVNHMCVILPQGELCRVDRAGGTVQTVESDN
jgi:hypothetical protein